MSLSLHKRRFFREPPDWRGWFWLLKRGPAGWGRAAPSWQGEGSPRGQQSRVSWGRVRVLARRAECGCGVRGRGAQLRERRVRGSGLFVFAPSGQVTIGAAVQQPPPPSETFYRAKVPESTLQPTPGSVSLPGCPSVHSPLCPRASPSRPRSAPARLDSLLVQLPNRKSVRVTRPPRAHARSQPPRLRLPRSPGWSRRAGGPCGRRASGTRRTVLSLPAALPAAIVPASGLRRNRRARGPARV